MGYESSEKYYDDLAESYDAAAAPKANYIGSINRIIQEHIKGKVTTYLDIGCGNGQRTKEIIYNVQPDSSTLVDTSREMIRLARQNVPGVSLLCLDPLSMSNENRFALITALWNVIGHFPNAEYKQKFFQKIHSLLLEEGLFVFDVNNRFNVKCYGMVAVLRNVIRDIVIGSQSGYFELKIPGKSKTRVYIHKPNELEAYIDKAKLDIVNKVYVNYSNGNIEKSPYKGQIVYILKKRQ